MPLQLFITHKQLLEDALEMMGNLFWRLVMEVKGSLGDVF